MTTQERTSTIRFVHDINQDDPIERGLTIAYLRTEDYVAFSWADKRPGEEYVKAIGREVTTDRLKALLLSDKFADLVKTQLVWKDTENMVAILNVQFLRVTVNHQNIWSNSMVNQLTWFDLKHVALSQLVLQIVKVS